MMVTNKIVEKVHNSPNINNLINSIVEKRHIDDFKQHLYLQLLEMDPDKLISADSGNYLDYLVIRIILNQYKSKSSSFYKIYKKNKTIEIIDYLTPSEGSNLADGLTYIEDFDVSDPYKNITIEDVLDMMNHRHFYHSFLWKKYYLEGKTYQQIQKETGINYQSVRVSVLKTNAWLKNKIDKL